MISPQFLILEMTLWHNKCFVQLLSLMMGQWGPKQAGVLYITALNFGTFIGLICSKYFTLILTCLLFTEQATAAVNIYTCILVGTGLNLCRETGHLHWIHREFPTILKEIYGVSSSIRPQLLPSKLFRIYFSWIIRSFKSIHMFIMPFWEYNIV